MMFNARNWYWKVAGNPGVYSSASNTYLPETDPIYLAWVAAGNRTSPINSEREIWDYVSPFWPSWLFDGDTFAQPALGAYMPAQLSAYAASVRYDKEVAGITVGGVHIDTDRESQGLIDRAYSAVQRNPSFTTRWKGANGTFGLVLNAASIIAVGDAVAAHVAACFAKEAELGDAIAAGTIKTPADIDAAFASVA
jgi:hypothetical protein